MPVKEQIREGLLRSGTSVPDPIPDYEVRPNALRKINFRGNSAATIGTSGDIGVNVGVLQSDTRIPRVFGGVFFGASLGKGCKCFNDGYWNAGTYAGRPGVVFSLKNNEHTYHYTTGVNGN